MSRNRKLETVKSWKVKAAWEDKTHGQYYSFENTYKRAVHGPQTVDEIAAELRKWLRTRPPGDAHALVSAIIKGLKRKYAEMAGDPGFDPFLHGESLYRYLDEKYGWTAEEESKEAQKQKRLEDLMVCVRVRMILGTLTQGSSPAGYREELREIGMFKHYRKELEFHGWDDDQIESFMKELGGEQ